MLLLTASFHTFLSVEKQRIGVDKIVLLYRWKIGRNIDIF